MPALVLLLFLAVAAYPQDWKAIFEDTGAPGMVLVVVRGNSAEIQTFGQSARGSGRKPAPDSLIRIGSLSKLMVAELLSGLVFENKLALEDLLSKFAPGPIAQAEDITLLHLATHTSGLPRNALGPDRWKWLAASPLAKINHSQALYSNVAFDFLADALAQRTAKPYAELLRDKLTQPLGMIDTTAKPSPEQCRRLLGGTAEDPTEPCLDMTPSAGSGGLYSTATDMAKWIRHLFAGGPQADKAQAVYIRREELSSVQGLDHAGPASGLGLGWVYLAAQNKRPELLQKTGGGGGFMSYIAIAPSRKIGVFVAMTRVDLDASKRLAASVNHSIELLSAAQRCSAPCNPKVGIAKSNPIQACLKARFAYWQSDAFEIDSHLSGSNLLLSQPSRLQNFISSRRIK